MWAGWGNKEHIQSIGGETFLKGSTVLVERKMGD